MKSSFLKASIIACAVCSFAMAEGAFIGYEGGYSFASNVKLSEANDGARLRKGQFNSGIKAGYDFDSFRAYGAYFYSFQTKKQIEDDDDRFTVKWKKHSLLAGVDYTPSITKDIKLVAGGYTGVSRLSITRDDVNKKFYDTGFVLGAKFGAEYLLDQNNILEAGIKTDYTFYKADDVSRVRESNIGLYVGYTYKF
ncbi:MAG: outer membrane beta-barrel protein [Campylobacter concisus]|nr:outer membrane beta-barrel protein [Campylobacter concisus]